MPGKIKSPDRIRGQDDRKNITLGTGFEPVEDLTIDPLGAYGWGARTADGARYKQRARGGGLDLTYLF